MAAQGSSITDERATPITTEAQVLQSTPLAELVGGSAGLCKWRLKVVGGPKEREYKYEKNGKENEGAAFSIVLVSIDPAQYCKGKFTRRGNNPKAKACFAEAKKNKDGTVWELSKAALYTQEKPLYIGSPVKVVIDLNLSTFTPVLQSIEFASVLPSPAEDLATLLDAANGQRVDVIALLVMVSPEREATTSQGKRNIVDVTIRDSSGPTSASQCEFALFFSNIHSRCK